MTAAIVWHLIYIYENVKKDDSYQIQVMGKEYNVFFFNAKSI